MKLFEKLQQNRLDLLALNSKTLEPAQLTFDYKNFHI